MKLKLLLFFITILITALGGYFTYAQILYLREFLVIFYGNELSIGLILSLWLIGITAGAFFGGIISRQAKDIAPLFFLIISVLTVIFVNEIYMVRLIRLIFNVPPGELIPFDKIFLSASTIILPFTFLAGAFFPIASQMVSQSAPSEKTTAFPIGKVYIAEAAGSIAAGILFTFWLVNVLNQFIAIAVFIFLIAILSVTTFSVLKKDFKRWASIIPSILILISIPILIYYGFPQKFNQSSILKRWSGFNPNINFVESIDTRYENLSLGLQQGQYNVFGNGHFMLSFPDIYQYAPTAHLYLTEHPDPKYCLLIGGGMGGLIEEILKHPVKKIVYVELDPQLIKLVSTHLSPKDSTFLADTRLNIHNIDGRYFVKNTKDKYDLIIVNVSDPSTAVINRYFTINFFREAAAALNDNGVFATKISSSVDYIGGEVGNYTGSVYHSIKKVFPYVVAAPGVENCIFAAKKNGIVTDNPKVLYERYKNAGVKTDYFSGIMFSQIFQSDRVQYVIKKLEESPVFALNTDFRPITYFYNLILWGKYSGSKITLFLSAVTRVKFFYIIIGLILLLILRLAYQSFNSPQRNLKFNTLLAISTTGMAGMALEIALIFMFQNVYGYVYQKIGLIVSMFMAGIAAGSLMINKCLKTEFAAADKYRLIFFETSILIFAAITPVIVLFLSNRGPGNYPAFITETIFYAMVFISGLLTGGEFPLASKIYISTGKSIGSTAGTIDSFDCFGAAIGAILTGLIMIPIFGLFQTCILIAMLKGGCVILLKWDGFIFLIRRFHSY